MRIFERNDVAVADDAAGPASCRRVNAIPSLVLVQPPIVLVREMVYVPVSLFVMGLKERVSPLEVAPLGVVVGPAAAAPLAA